MHIQLYSPITHLANTSMWNVNARINSHYQYTYSMCTFNVKCNWCNTIELFSFAHSTITSMWNVNIHIQLHSPIAESTSTSIWNYNQIIVKHFCKIDNERALTSKTLIFDDFYLLDFINQRICVINYIQLNKVIVLIVMINILLVFIDCLYTFIDIVSIIDD